MQHPSICIPHARKDTNATQVKDVFEKLFGNNCIKHVDCREYRSNRDQSFFKRYFVHFNFWPESAKTIQNKLLAGKEIKIVYSEPWFWKCSATRSHHVPRPRLSLPTPRK